MQVKEISALIRLLEDPDETVFYHVKDKILSFGNEVIPLLESAWETSFEPLMQKRIENIIHQLQFVILKPEYESGIWREEKICLAEYCLWPNTSILT